jgi:hypothetical protein
VSRQAPGQAPPTFLDADTGNGFGPEIFDGTITLPRPGHH